MALRNPDEIVELLQEASSLTRDLMEENARLRQRLGEAEVESQKFADRYAQVAEQSELLQNLFVVVHRLHASLDPQEVLATIKDVLVNLVGSEDFAIWSLAPGGERQLLTYEGAEAAAREFASAHDELLRGATEGEPFFRAEGESAGPVAAFALRIGERPLGVVAIRNLLPQKPRLTDGDQQIIEVLANQGAVAVMAAQLYGRALRGAATLELEVRS